MKPGDTVDVTISGGKFKGFLLQVFLLFSFSSSTLFLTISQTQAQDSEGKLVGSFESGGASILFSLILDCKRDVF